MILKYQWYILSVIFLKVLAGIFASAFAQKTSFKGNFEVNVAEGCEGLEVVVNNLFQTNTPKQYIFEFNGIFTGNIVDTVHTYVQPGNYTLVQIIGGVNSPGGIVDSIHIEVFPPVEPDFRIIPCEGRSATIEVASDQYDAYRVNFTAVDQLSFQKNVDPPSFIYPDLNPKDITVRGLFIGGQDNCAQSTRTFTPVDNLVPATLNGLTVENTDPVDGSIRLDFILDPNLVYQLEAASSINGTYSSLEILDASQTSAVVSGLNTSTETHCFRITAIDGCDATNNLASEPVCSIVLETEAQNNQNQVQWQNQNTGTLSYLLLRDNLNLANLNNAGNTQYTDPDVLCGVEYCYQLEARLSNNRFSRSGVVCETAFSSDLPPAINNLTSSLVRNGVELEWDDPENVVIPVYNLKRAREGGNSFGLVATSSESENTDTVAYSLSNRFCYQVDYNNACGIRSGEGITSCPVFLSLEDDENQIQKLTWTAYQGWENGIAGYEIEKFDQSGNLVATTDVANALEYLEDENLGQQVITYRVKVIPNDEFLPFAYSNLVRVVYRARIFFPNAFTPDGNNNNEIFNFAGTFIQEGRLQIFNRWGELVFSTEDKDEGWDGSYRGVPADAGVYVYKAEITDFLQNTLTEMGTVLLIR